MTTTPQSPTPAASGLIKAATLMRDTINAHGNMDEGCLYYNGYSSPELQGALHCLTQALAAQPASGVGGDDHLRRLIGRLAQWQHCMSYNDSYFGEPAGMMKKVVAELARAVDPIYPSMPEPVNPFANVVIHTATESFTPNADGTRPAESVAQGGEVES